jgi:hypothetical protein
MMTLKRTGTAGAVGLASGITGSAGPLIAGGAAVAGGILSATSPQTLPEFDAGLLDGGLAVSGYYLSGLAIWLGVVALVGIGAVFVVESASRTPINW